MEVFNRIASQFICPANVSIPVSVLLIVIILILRPGGTIVV